MHEEVMYTGNLFQIIHRKESFKVPVDGDEKKVDLEYELVRRPPGVRAIVIRNGNLLLNKEFRYELNRWDYRLPGGKVFDSLDQASGVESRKELRICVEEALQRELREEADLQAKSFSLYECSYNGFTVEWDLYYYIIDDFISVRQSGDFEQKSEFEYIQSCWVNYRTALEYCLDRKISEERSVGVLLRFLLTQIEEGEWKHVFSEKK